MTKALIVDTIIPKEYYDKVFKQVFGVDKRTILAESIMQSDVDGYCYLCPEGDCVYGEYPRTKQKLKEFDEIIYLSQMFNDYNIGSM